MNAYIHVHSTRPDGTCDSFATVAVDCKESPLWWQNRGLSFTATGYGSRIPTRHMVKFNGRWRRVYCRVFSNIGTFFIGHGENRFTVSLEN